jgi:hypothetical protein
MRPTIDRLAPFADTEQGKVFAAKLWNETLAECVRVDKRSTNGLVA